MSSPDEATHALVVAIRAGDVQFLGRILTEHPGLASAPLGGAHGTRTALHVATDWPGYFPNGPEIVGALIEAGGRPSVPEIPERYW